MKPLEQHPAPASSRVSSKPKCILRKKAQVHDLKKTRALELTAPVTIKQTLVNGMEFGEEAAEVADNEGMRNRPSSGR